MAPTVLDGATVQIVPVKPPEIRRGDIVLFRMVGVGTAFHRVARIFKQNGEPYVQTWGDNVKHPDRPVPQTEVLGRVSAFKASAGGTWKILERTTWGYAKYFVRRYSFYYSYRLLVKGVNRVNN